MGKWDINLSLVPLKAQYFLWNAGTSPIVPFLPTYARQLGFSSVIVGTIYTILPVSGMLAKPFFGALADRYHLQKRLFVIFQIITLIAFFMIQFIPEIPARAVGSLTCETQTYIKVCVNGSADECAVSDVVKEMSMIQCQMQCTSGETSLLNDVCNHWNVTDCMNSWPLSFTANVNMNHTILLENCFYFRVASVVFQDGTQLTPWCEKLSLAQCSFECNDPTIMEVTSYQMDDAHSTSLYQFWVFFCLLIISWVGMAVVVSLGDTICFGMLGERVSQYGNQRLWGAVGWGIFSVLAGLLVDEFSKGQSRKDYTVIFYMMLIMLLLDVAVSSKLEYSHTQMSASILHDVGRLLKIPRILIFIVWIITVGLCTGLLWQFLFWHLEDLAALRNGCGVQRWVKTLEGLVMGIQCFGGELPFFFLSGHILKKIGHVHAMSLVLLGFGVRFILYSFLSNPWWCLPIELFQGITFGIFYTTMTSYASIVAPPGTEATMQGLVSALFEGVGVSLGSLLGGVLIELYRGDVTFRLYGLGALIVFVLHVFVQYLMNRSPEELPENLAYVSQASARYAAPTEALRILDEPDMDQLATT